MADEVKMESDGTIMEFNYLTVTDPQNFMNVLDRFDKSECAENWRNESDVGVSLWSLRGSGNTHFILVVYENAEKMEKGRAVFNSCSESAAMIKSFQNNTDTDRSWNWVAENVVAADQWTTDTVFAKYNFKVDEGHESHYLNSWKNLMSANLDNINGSFGMNRVLFGNRYVSHMVYVGNESLDGLLTSQNAVLSSDAFLDFSMDVKDIRQNVNVELVSLVKFYTGE
tara:strand:- start:761 stop:1438 length:678 start_codon:yes stop_codon:yes gene_type:complete